VDRIVRLEDFKSRNSNALDQFFSYIKGESGLSILDLAGANQANVTFITGLGHRIYSEDFLRSLHFAANGSGQPHLDSFLKQNLNHADASFDGVLVWDVLEYLSAPMLAATVERLFRIAKPGSYLLAVFQAQEKTAAAPQYSFRIQDSKTLLVADRGTRKLEQFFNNRSLEKLFHNFESLKFFLTRDKLREVIVRR
jgi:2-polyprenyl-3-methyl-5-hydroxy-6-metoxy-1,4-benzoquinol methylase